MLRYTVSTDITPGIIRLISEFETNSGIFTEPQDTVTMSSAKTQECDIPSVIWKVILWTHPIGNSGVFKSYCPETAWWWMISISIFVNRNHSLRRNYFNTVHVLSTGFLKCCIGCYIIDCSTYSYCFYWLFLLFFIVQLALYIHLMYVISLRIYLEVPSQTH